MEHSRPAALADNDCTQAMAAVRASRSGTATFAQIGAALE
jgi:hypothetical protein